MLKCHDHLSLWTQVNCSFTQTQIWKITEDHITALELWGIILLATGGHLKTLMHILMVFTMCSCRRSGEVSQGAKHRMKIGSVCCLWAFSPVFIKGIQKSSWIIKITWSQWGEEKSLRPLRLQDVVARSQWSLGETTEITTLGYRVHWKETSKGTTGYTKSTFERFENMTSDHIKPVLSRLRSGLITDCQCFRRCPS